MCQIRLLKPEPAEAGLQLTRTTSDLTDELAEEVEDSMARLTQHVESLIEPDTVLKELVLTLSEAHASLQRGCEAAHAEKRQLKVMIERQNSGSGGGGEWMAPLEVKCSHSFVFFCPSFCQNSH